MVRDPRTSVINADHRAHDVPNLYIVDGSSFVTSGPAPTITIQALYFEPIKEWINRFYMKDGKLMIDPDFQEGNNSVLLPLGQNHFKVGGGPVEIVFVRPIAGGPMQVKVISGGKTRGTLDAVKSETPTSAQLAEFTGKYVSDELPGTTYTLSIKDGKLLLLVRNGITVFSDRGLVLAITPPGTETLKDILLTPEFADAFVTIVDGHRVMVRFTRNQQNAISGFTLSTRLVRRVRFNKQ
jgi:GMC oxidoreductase